MNARNRVNIVTGQWSYKEGYNISITVSVRITLQWSEKGKNILLLLFFVSFHFLTMSY